METVVQDFLQLQLYVVDMMKTQYFWLGAILVVSFVFLTRSPGDTRYLMESHQLTRGWWDGEAQVSAHPVWRQKQESTPAVQKGKKPRAKVGVNQMRNRAA